MILRLALRSLATRPVRTAVLACGFGFGIAVMAALLGVGEVILEQANSPALEGGGDVVITGRFGRVDNARFLMSSVLGSPDLAAQAITASPSKRATLYLLKDGRTTAVAVTGGLPGLERSVGDHEVEAASTWVDAPTDRECVYDHRAPDLEAAATFLVHRPEWLSRSSDELLEFLRAVERSPDEGR